MAAYLARSVTKQSTMCEPGDFLYRTVTPIYEIVAKNMGKYVPPPQPPTES